MNAQDSIYKDAYNKLLSDLEHITVKKVVIEQDYQEKMAEADKEYETIQRALEALKPLAIVNTRMVKVCDPPANMDPAGTTVSWRSDCLRFLSKHPDKSFTSPEIFEGIYPGANDLEKLERRRKMISVSQALGALVEEGKISSEDNEGGRGLKYQLLKQEALSLDRAS